MTAVAETILVARNGLTVDEFDSFSNPECLFAIGDCDGNATVAIAESLVVSGNGLRFLWWVTATEMFVGHERALCRFLSERLVDKWTKTP